MTKTREQKFDENVVASINKQWEGSIQKLSEKELTTLEDVAELIQNGEGVFVVTNDSSYILDNQGRRLPDIKHDAASMLLLDSILKHRKAVADAIDKETGEKEKE